MEIAFPRVDQAPSALRDPDDNCGPFSMWLVLEALGISVDTATINRLSRYRSKVGVSTLGLALGFHDLGLKTEFRCEGVCPEDKLLMQEAQAKGLPILPALDLNALLALPALLVVAYDMSDGGPHVSPVYRLNDQCVVVALEEIHVQAINTLEARRRHSWLESISIYPSKIP